MGVLESGVRHSEVEQAVVESLRRQGDPRRRHVREVGKAHHAGFRDLPEHHLALGAVLRLPGPHPALQGAPHPGRQFRMEARQLLIQPHGADARSLLEDRNDLFLEYPLQRVRPPSSAGRAPRTTVRALDAIGRGRAESGARRRNRGGFTLPLVHVYPHLAFRDVWSRHGWSSLVGEPAIVNHPARSPDWPAPGGRPVHDVPTNPIPYP